jgi:hypothetical protein
LLSSYSLLLVSRNADCAWLFAVSTTKCLLHCLLDERTSAGQRRDDQMNTKCRAGATHAKSPRGLRTCGDGRRVRGLELGSAALA